MKDDSMGMVDNANPKSPMIFQKSYCSEQITDEGSQPLESAVDEELRFYATHPVDVQGTIFALPDILETLLFVSDSPVEASHLSKVLNLNVETIYGGLKALNRCYTEQNTGLRVQEHNGRFQLVTHPQLAQLVEEYLSIDLTTKLSTPALETLAIVAYRQPVTRAQIESVRGVDSSGILRSLLQRGLIDECGRLEGVGRPILYSVTEEFMRHFGLTGLDELPPLETTDADTLWATTQLAEMAESAAIGTAQVDKG